MKRITLFSTYTSNDDEVSVYVTEDYDVFTAELHSYISNSVIRVSHATDDSGNIELAGDDFYETLEQRLTSYWNSLTLNDFNIRTLNVLLKMCKIASDYALEYKPTIKWIN